MEAEPTIHRASERSAHAIYGLIIITAALVADREHVDDALAALAMVWGAGLVLLLAHLYAAIAAAVGQRGHLLSHAERHVLILDNAPLLAAIIVPSVLIGLAGLGVLDLRAAIDLSIVVAVVSLFALGALQARSSGASVRTQVALGTLGAAMGALVIALEVALAH